LPIVGREIEVMRTVSPYSADLALVVLVDDHRRAVDECLTERDQKVRAPNFRPETGDSHELLLLRGLAAEQILETALVLGLHDLVGGHGFELRFGDLRRLARAALRPLVAGALEPLLVTLRDPEIRSFLE
jgi:hypothetical protein